MLLRLLTFPSAILLLKMSFQFINEIACCIHTVLHFTALDCATLDCQINLWKASTAAIRNTNDQANFQM